MLDEQEVIWGIVQKARDLFSASGVTLPQHAELEISHHYGLSRFEDFGLLMVTVVNRDYCKKLLGVLPGQSHPEQYHNRKEESFHCLSGELDLVLDGERRVIRPGDVVLVQPGVRHSFSSKSGCVIEEISSTHFKDDSFYTDESIDRNPNRKTFVSFWT
jgi:quercetin dioxygenase-like cupin family protein